MKFPTRFFICLVVLPALLAAQDIPNPDFHDAAVIPFFHEHNPDIVYFQTIYKTDVDSQHTLLLVRAGDPTKGRHPSHPNSTYRIWAERDLLGLFLQDTNNTDQVWKLAVLPREESYGAEVTVDRADSQSIVLTLTGDYGMREPFLKLFFDVGSKQFLGQLRYRPVGINQAIVMPYPLPERGSPSRAKNYFVGSFEGKPLVVARQGAGFVLVEDEEEREAVLRFLAENPQRTPSWGAPYGPEEAYQADYWDRSVKLEPIDFPPPGSPPRFYVSFTATEGRRYANGVLERTPDGYKLYPLPQSTLEEHRRLRPERDQQQGRQIDWTIKEKIGPCFIFPGSPPNPRTGESMPPRFWFAKTFYDGEGYSGVGGVGYFDTERREYVIFSPPELAPWSASALMVGVNDTVWVGLYRQTEGAAYSGGLLHFDPVTGNARVYNVKEIVALIYPGPVLGTTDGIYTLRDEQLERFVIEPDLSGKLHIIAAGSSQ